MLPSCKTRGPGGKAGLVKFSIETEKFSIAIELEAHVSFNGKKTACFTSAFYSEVHFSFNGKKPACFTPAFYSEAHFSAGGLNAPLLSN